jgi:3-oxoacyl-[acyl-carrier protein] reductase
MTNYMNDQFGLTGKRALVTGAARGIGRAIAEALAFAGARVCVHFHQSEAAAREACSAIASATGDNDRAWSTGADLTDSGQTRALFERVSQRWNGALDILVNNTGDLVRRCTVADFTDELLEQVLRVNIHSAIFATRSAIPLLKRGKDPVVINLSSVAAHNGGANGAAVYAATKGAIHTLTRGLAKELAPEIRVNAIAPGVALTDFHRRHSSEQFLEQIRANTPLKRLGTAEDQGAAAVFLCAKSGSFITGEVIEINGGLWLA